MSDTEKTLIIFDNGAVIADVPQNADLLEQIEETPALSPTDLLKLGKFYEPYSTNKLLADQLVILALVQFVESKNSSASGSVDRTAGDFWSEAADVAEDFWNGSVDSEDQHGQESFFVTDNPIIVRWVPFSGIGLLIATNKVGGTFVHRSIGFCPDPTTLRVD